MIRDCDIFIVFCYINPQAIYHTSHSVVALPGHSIMYFISFVESFENNKTFTWTSTDYGLTMLPGTGANCCYQTITRLSSNCMQVLYTLHIAAVLYNIFEKLII